MSRSLHTRPDLNHLRSQAKHLLSKLRTGDAAAVRTFVRHLPAAKGMTASQVEQAGFRLADAQSAIARKSGFATWPALARHVEQLRGLEGEWTFVSLEVDGREMPPVALGQSRLLIDGDRFRMESQGGDYEGLFNLDVEADPSHIDIEFVEGPEAGNWAYGIYRLDQDSLYFCLGLVGAPRPTEFKTTPGSGHALEHLRRSSRSRPADITGGHPKITKSRASVAAESVDEAAFAVVMTAMLQQLQGEWTPLSLVTDDTPLDPLFLTFGTRTTTGNEVKVVFGGQVMVHVKMRLDEGQLPVAVDYLNIGRGTKGVTLGIVELRGDVARFCMAPAGAPRPAEFSSDKGSGRTLSEWRRR